MKFAKYMLSVMLVMIAGNLSASVEPLPDIGGKFGILEKQDVVSPPILAEEFYMDYDRQLSSVNCNSNIWLIGKVKIRYFIPKIKVKAKAWSKYGSSSSACGGYYQAKIIGAKFTRDAAQDSYILKSGEISNSSYIKVKRKSRDWGEYFYTRFFVTTQYGNKIDFLIKKENKLYKGIGVSYSWTN